MECNRAIMEFGPDGTTRILWALIPLGSFTIGIKPKVDVNFFRLPSANELVFLRCRDTPGCKQQTGE